ncbi:MAG: hypothetical protein GQ546_14235 [Gammaproteobacteria bacterium]|nr:hypothetical protein [Gammaproteobacteria bacterium]
MKKLIILSLFALSLSAISVQASETETAVQPSYNSGSDWWIEVTPEDPDYDLYKDVQVNCFCG